jgi:DEAD/DEAH box helicase domain-containing protein
LAEAYRVKGIQELYSHQALTAGLVREGKNVVAVTPTASGKTLCFNLPVLNAVLENPDTRALYLFPTKKRRRGISGPSRSGATTSASRFAA